MRWITMIVFMVISVLGVSFLQPDEAFKPKITAVDDDTVAVEIVLGDQIYLYKEKLKIEDADSKDGIEFTTINTTTKTVDHDGESVYEENPVVTVDLGKNKSLSGEQNVRVKLSYQGCSSAGLCYEPQESILEIPLNADKLALITNLSAPAVVKKEISVPKNGSETDKIADVISGGSVWFIILSFFGFGLLLALTPCVFPMIPIISSVIMAQGEGLGAKRAFFLSLVYVLAMAVAYTIAGVLAGLFGSNLQAAFQTPWIITVFALVFVLLSLSMFDVYELQIPNFIQSRISKLGGARSGVVGRHLPDQPRCLVTGTGPVGRGIAHHSAGR